ncbi:hypothetical protein [Flavobacterium sp. 3HN19-14]|uniref:hypothetical protein n=1 Tax=Flavobacterium sp. 3HN19-14 TaxID=3448133 RepID=UPI003EE0C890
MRYFIEKAQINSPLISDYSYQITTAALDSLIDRAGYRPQLSGNFNKSYAPVINGYGYDTALSNGQTLNALIGYNQKIIGGNRKATQSESFRLIKQSLSLNKKVAVKDLDKAVTAQYITAWALYRKSITTKRRLSFYWKLKKSSKNSPKTAFTNKPII